jgi:hypothetical protein
MFALDRFDESGMLAVEDEPAARLQGRLKLGVHPSTLWAPTCGTGQPDRRLWMIPRPIHSRRRFRTAGAGSSQDLARRIGQLGWLTGE